MKISLCVTHDCIEVNSKVSIVGWSSLGSVILLYYIDTTTYKSIGVTILSIHYLLSTYCVCFSIM